MKAAPPALAADYTTPTAGASRPLLVPALMLAATAIIVVVALVVLRNDGDSAPTDAATDAPSSAADDDRGSTTDDTAPEEEPTDGFHPAGVGPVRIGMTRDQVEAAVGATVAWEPAFEGTSCSSVSFPQSGLVAGTVDLSIVTGLSGDGLTLGYLEVNDYQHLGLAAATVEGVALGDPEQRIAEIYGDVEVETRPYGEEPDHWVSVDLPDGNAYIFGATAGTIDQVRVGHRPDVEAIEGCA